MHSANDRAADGIHYQADALPSGRFKHRLGKGTATRPEGNIEAKRFQLGQLLRGTGSTDDLGAERLRRLQRGNADARASRR